MKVKNLDASGIITYGDSCFWQLASCKKTSVPDKLTLASRQPPDTSRFF